MSERLIDLERALEALRNLRDAVLNSQVLDVTAKRWNMEQLADATEEARKALLREHAEPGPVDGLLSCPFCAVEAKPAPGFEHTAVFVDHLFDCPLHDDLGHRRFWPMTGWNRRTAPAPGANAVRVIRKGLEEAMRYLNSDYPEEDDGMTADQACERARVAVIDAIAALRGKP